MKSACALLLAAAALGAAAAAPPPSPERVSIQVAQVLPEMLEAWQNAVKAEGIPGQKKAGVAWRHTYTKAPFGQSYTFVTMTPISSFGEYDQPSALLRGLGEEGLVRYNANVRPMVVSINTMAMTFERQASIVSVNQKQAALLLVETLYPLPGRTLEYTALVATECLPHYSGARIKNYWLYTSSLGSSSMIMVVRPLEKLAELDQPDSTTQALEAGLGAEAASKLRQRLDGLLSSMGAKEIYRYIPELSFGGPAPTQTR